MATQETVGPVFTRRPRSALKGCVTCVFGFGLFCTLFVTAFITGCFFPLDALFLTVFLCSFSSSIFLNGEPVISAADSALRFLARGVLQTPIHLAKNIVADCSCWSQLMVVLPAEMRMMWVEMKQLTGWTLLLTVGTGLLFLACLPQ